MTSLELAVTCLTKYENTGVLIENVLSMQGKSECEAETALEMSEGLPNPW
jgi:hypothetical protein